MRSRFPGFATVRVVCGRCGWFRVLGPTGSNGTVRAFIRLARDPSACNLVWSRVIAVPAGSETEAWAARAAGYRDLAAEWDWRRPHREVAAAIGSCRPLVQGRACPRCKRVGRVRLEVCFEPEPGRASGYIVMCEPHAEPGAAPDLGNLRDGGTPAGRES